jgi:hypothetical protein
VIEATFAHNVLLFGRLLRAAGMDVHHGRLIDALRALEWVGVRSRMDVRATLRSLLVHNRDELERFDEAFELFFHAHRAPSPGPALFSLGERPRVVARAVPALPVPVQFESAGTELARSPTRAVGAWSAHGLSRTKDFSEYSVCEMERARTLLETLPWELSLRRTRRSTHAATGAIDLKPVLRRNLLRGDLLDLPRRRRRVSPRPVVVMADVSGSMERYSRILLHFAYGLVHSGTRVEVFVFATRLTRVSRHVGGSRGGGALARVTRAVQDWGGGTRIGEALRTFNTRWARRVMRNGPVTILVSDGWDRGDPELLSRELTRLRRSSHRLIWLNPLLGSASYEPLTRGMQAALHHVDDFLPAHNLTSIEQLVEHLRKLRK